MLGAYPYMRSHVNTFVLKSSAVDAFHHRLYSTAIGGWRMPRKQGFFGPSERALEFGAQYADVLARWWRTVPAASALVASNVALGKMTADASKRVRDLGPGDRERALELAEPGSHAAIHAWEWATAQRQNPNRRSYSTRCRYWIASARCAVSIGPLLARSAMVRATLAPGGRSGRRG